MRENCSREGVSSGSESSSSSSGVVDDVVCAEDDPAEAEAGFSTSYSTCVVFGFSILVFGTGGGSGFGGTYCDKESVTVR